MKIAGAHPWVVTPEMVTEMLECAIDAAYGGSLYWMSEYPTTADRRGAEYMSDLLALDGTMTIHELVDESTGESVEHVLDLAAAQRGIRKAAEHWHMTVAGFMGDCDADRADVALQYAVLGEVRYG